MNASVIGIGTDIVQISRMRKAIARWADRLALRILSADEWAYCRTRRDAAPHVAARFAAKEAGMKALGLGWAGADALQRGAILRVVNNWLAVGVLEAKANRFDPHHASRAPIEGG